MVMVILLTMTTQLVAVEMATLLIMAASLSLRVVMVVAMMVEMMVME